MNWFKKSPKKERCVICGAKDDAEHMRPVVTPHITDKKECTICRPCYDSIINLSPRYIELQSRMEVLREDKKRADRYIATLSDEVFQQKKSLDAERSTLDLLRQDLSAAVAEIDTLRNPPVVVTTATAIMPNSGHSALPVDFCKSIKLAKKKKPKKKKK